MAGLIQQARVELDVHLKLNEDEARALEALVGYGVDPFLRVFYKELGKAYLEPHEAGLRTLFAAVRDDLPMILERARKARVVFTGRREHTSDDRLIAAAWK